MPIVLSVDGYDVVIRTNDHEPPHVHVFKGDGEAKINISPVELVAVWNMKKQVARRARSIVEGNQEFLLERWRDIHG